MRDNRQQLREQLAAARKSIRAARAALAALTSAAIYDVEYEGEVGAYMRAYLDDADRALAAAEAINPGR